MMGKAVVTCMFAGMLGIISIIDIRKKQIYNETVAVLLVPAIVSFFIFPEIDPGSRALGAISVSSIMLCISLLIPGAFGGGDIKLMVPVGMFLGLEKALVAGIAAVLMGGIWSIMTLWRRKKQFAFGPALAIGSMIAFVWGDMILEWYL